jgi:CHAT domain-containing protein
MGAASSSLGKAIQELKEANEISERNGFQHVYAWSAFELAGAYRNVGDLDAAERLASKTVEFMRELEDVYHLPQHLGLLANLESQKGNFEIADQLYSEATDVMNGLLVNVVRRQLKGSLIATLSDAYVGHFELAATKFSDVGKAYEIIEEARGRALADTLQGESESLSSSSDEITIGANQEITRIQLALMHESSPQARQSLLDQLFGAEQLLAPEAKVHSALNSSNDHRKGVPIHTIQASLRGDEMLLEYVMGESQSYCLRITRTSSEILVLRVDRKTIEKLVDDYLAAVRSRQSEITAGGKLFSLLLKPAISKDPKPRLTIIPDGKLHLLPFDGLTDQNGKYVLESHIVTYAPSATVLHLLRQSHSEEKLAMSFLGVGDVIYPGRAVATANASGRATTKHNATADFFDLQGVTFPELPGSRQEVVSVAEVMSGDKRALLGKDATEAEFKKLPLADFRVIHLAVHGLGNSEFPDRAALVLGSSPTVGQDGLLQVREIRDLPLRADLVTLSACDTGNGKLLGEEGIASLEHAFLLAGAKSVIASLWTADDTYTVALMKRLYQHLIDGFDEGAALRQAKLDLLKQFAGQALPIFWAGFTLAGDGATALAK